MATTPDDGVNRTANSLSDASDDAAGPKRSRITLEYDSATDVWFAHSDDIPGLHVGAKTLTKMGEHLERAVSLLLELNHATLKYPAMTGLPLWTVYDHPNDWPDGFIARKFVNDQPTQECVHAPTLDGVRRLLPNGLARIERHASDDPVIVEVWL